MILIVTDESKEEGERLKNESLNSPSELLSAKIAHEQTSNETPRMISTEKPVVSISQGFGNDAPLEMGPAKQLVQELKEDELEALNVKNSTGCNVIVSANKNKTKREVVVVISGLSSEQMSNMDLHVSTDAIVVTLGKADTVNIEGKLNLHNDEIFAKMSRKHCRLTIKGPYYS